MRATHQRHTAQETHAGKGSMNIMLNKFVTFFHLLTGKMLVPENYLLIVNKEKVFLLDKGRRLVAKEPAAPLPSSY